jgi:hypothetical protein
MRSPVQSGSFTKPINKASDLRPATGDGFRSYVSCFLLLGLPIVYSEAWSFEAWFVLLVMGLGHRFRVFSS